ncbi:unnamed protein product [Calicophoron daubneyi]|uniref:Uncharacterized protein n=1 Tax=Calicophoron daubneyi TaxID=300641 RepID=A0AAV2SZM1_CALDB
MDRQTQGVIFESIARILKQSNITVKQIPVSDETKQIVTELIDLLGNCKNQYEYMFGHGGEKNTDIEDAASRLVCFIANLRDIIIKSV